MSCLTCQPSHELQKEASSLPPPKIDKRTEASRRSPLMMERKEAALRHFIRVQIVKRFRREEASPRPASSQTHLWPCSAVWCLLASSAWYVAWLRWPSAV